MVIVTTLLLVLLSSPAWAQLDTDTADAPTVTVGVNHAPPYRMMDNGVARGLDLEVFEAISRQLGWAVQYREAPIRRALKLVEEGEIDVLLGPRRTQAREEHLDFALAAFPAERRLFFYQTGTQRIDRYEDLYGRVIGVLEGAHYFPRFDADDRIMKESATKYSNLMRMLDRGRVDVVIAPEVVGQYAANRLGLSVSVSPYSVPGERRYIAVSRRSPVHAQVDRLRKAYSLNELDEIYRDHVANYLEKAEQ